MTDGPMLDGRPWPAAAADGQKCRLFGCNEPATTVARVQNRRGGLAEATIEVPACARHREALEQGIRLAGGGTSEQRSPTE